MLKRLFTILLTVVLFFALGACGQEPAKDYTDAIISSQELVASEPMSEWQLICVLESQGYSDADITEILKQANIDWNIQALRICEMLLNEEPTSKVAMEVYLDILKFSESQIEYAFTNLKVDWNEQCLYAAMLYIEMGEIDTNLLKSNLSTDGFTVDEIEYAIGQMN